MILFSFYFCQQDSIRHTIRFVLLDLNYGKLNVPNLSCSSCTYIDGSGRAHDLDNEEITAPKADEICKNCIYHIVDLHLLL